MVLRPRSLGLDVPRHFDPLSSCDCGRHPEMEGEGDSRRAEMLRQMRQNHEEIARLEHRNNALRKRLNVASR